MTENEGDKERDMRGREEGEGKSPDGVRKRRRKRIDKRGTRGKGRIEVVESDRRGARAREERKGKRGKGADGVL